MFSCLISDILREFAQVDTLIMGDVTYGACCVDDYTARAVGCDFMIHYGHSCLVPVQITTIKTLYVFVDIGIDQDHFVKTVVHNLSLHNSKHIELVQDDQVVKKKLALVGTIQFIAALQVFCNVFLMILALQNIVGRRV